MQPSRRPRRCVLRPLFLAIGSLLALSSCGDGPPAEGPGRLDRPAVVQTGEKPVSQIVESLQPPEELSPWTVTGAKKAKVVPLGGEGRGLQIEGKGEKRIVIPGTYSPRDFNQIVVSGIFRAPVGVQAFLEGEEQDPYKSQELVTVNSPDEQPIILDLPRLFVRRKPFQRLVLVLKCSRETFLRLNKVDLIHRPASMNLPGPEETHKLINVGGESRLGFGIGSAFGAQSTFTVEEAADELRFTYGVPAALGAGRKGLRFRYELTAAGEVVKQDELPVSSKEWKTVRVPLADYVGQELSVAFSGESKGNLETIIGVSNLQVMRPAENPRTVLMVTSDTHRGDHVGFSKSGIVLDTPNLDALADRGVAFIDAHATTNVTSPSHVTVMTGIHPRDHRVIGNTSKMIESAQTLAERYADAGWATTGVVSVRHLGPLGTGLDQGYDLMYAPPGEPWDAEDAMDLLLPAIDAAEGQPLFVWLHLFDAHYKYAPPGPFDRKYYPKGKDPFDKARQLQATEGNIPKDLTQLTDVEFPKSQYRAEIDYIDFQLGRLFAVPRIAEGVIAMTSDHGEILEKDGTFFNHSEIFPDTLHVPMVLAFPDGPVARTDNPVSNLDLGRTLLDLSGLGGQDFPGTNMLTVLDSPPEEEARFALSAHGNSASITEDGWFYLLHLRTHKGPLRRERKKCESELYNLTDDPECLLDRKHDDPERAGAMCRKLTAWLSGKSGPSLSMSGGGKTVADIQALQALGYATDGEEQAEETPWLDPNCEPCKNF